MTPENIAELRGLFVNATPGPWRDVKSVARVTRDRQGASDQTGSVDIADCGNMKDKELVPFNAIRWRADAKLIATARTALPEALSEIERLRAGVTKVLGGYHTTTAKNSECSHDRYGWEDCNICVDEYLQRLLDGA